MLNHSNTQKELASWTGWSLILASVLLFGLAVYYASRFIGVQNEMVVDVNIGVIHLLSLAKTRVDGGFTGSITYLYGLIWYYAFFLVGGILAGLYQSRKN